MLTIDDLVRIYWNGEHEINSNDGMRRVVRALRDGMMREFERCDSCSGIEHVEPFFSEILGSDAGEKAAGGPTREDGRVAGSLGAGQHAGTPAAAPAVCVWTIVGQDCARWIETDCGMSPDEYDEGQLCYCGKTIKFMTENER